MRKKSDDYIIISGASQGLGKAMAKEFAAKGYNIVLVALPKEQLPHYCNELADRFAINAIHFETDLTNLTNIKQFHEWIAAKKLNIKGLVNNAGLGGTSVFEECSIDFINDLILLNIRALTLLTRHFVPVLKKHPDAFILNVSSVAAFQPIPYKTVYPASKAFVYSFSIGLMEELKNTSIKVSVMHPGPMQTTLDGCERLERHGLLGKIIKLDVEEVAAIGVKQTLAGKPVIIPGAVNRFSSKLMKLLPSFLTMPIFYRLFRKELRLGGQIQEA